MKLVEAVLYRALTLKVPSTIEPATEDVGVVREKETTKRAAIEAEEKTKRHQLEEETKRQMLARLTPEQVMEFYRPVDAKRAGSPSGSGNKKARKAQPPPYQSTSDVANVRMLEEIAGRQINTPQNKTWNYVLVVIDGPADRFNAPLAVATLKHAPVQGKHVYLLKSEKKKKTKRFWALALQNAIPDVNDVTIISIGGREAYTKYVGKIFV